MISLRAILPYTICGHSAIGGQALLPNYALAHSIIFHSGLEIFLYINHILLKARGAGNCRTLCTLSRCRQWLLFNEYAFYMTSSVL